MSQMNPREVFHNTAYSVQLPFIAGHSLSTENFVFWMTWLGFCRRPSKKRKYYEYRISEFDRKWQKLLILISLGQYLLENHENKK